MRKTYYYRIRKPGTVFVQLALATVNAGPTAASAKTAHPKIKQ